MCNNERSRKNNNNSNSNLPSRIGWTFTRLYYNKIIYLYNESSGDESLKRTVFVVGVDIHLCG